MLDRDAGKDRLECPRRSLVSGTGRGTESPDIQLKMGNGATRGMNCPVVYTAPQGSAKPSTTAPQDYTKLAISTVFSVQEDREKLRTTAPYDPPNPDAHSRITERNVCSRRCEVTYNQLYRETP